MLLSVVSFAERSFNFLRAGCVQESTKFVIWYDNWPSIPMYSILSTSVPQQYHLARAVLNQYISLPAIHPSKNYLYNGPIPSAKQVLVGVVDILSTIHPMYALVAAVFLMTFFALYIKARYPFWNQVPALHVYDWHRRWLYPDKPYIIHPLHPKKTKYYVSEPTVQSSRFSDLDIERRQEMVKLLQSHYLASDRVFCSIQLADLEAQCSGSVVSTYNTLLVATTAVAEQPPLDSASSSSEMEDDGIVERMGVRNPPIQIIEGFISSRSVNISVSVGKADKRYIVLEPAHYMDYICFSRTLVSEKKTRGLFHTHEYNQRMLMPDKKITIFKKEIDLCDALVPLVQYDALTFYLRMRIEPTIALPANFQMVRIQKENQNHLQDWMERVVSMREDIGFRVSVVAEIGYIINQLRTNQLYAYVLRGPDILSPNKLDAVYAIYFFKNAHVKYEDLEAGDTAHCVAAFCNTNDFDLYFLGFVLAVREVKKDLPGAKMLMMDDIGHVRGLARKWTETHDVVLRTPCAYYLTNYIVPRSAFREDEVCFLL